MERDNTKRMALRYFTLAEDKRFVMFLNVVKISFSNVLTPMAGNRLFGCGRQSGAQASQC